MTERSQRMEQVNKFNTYLNFPIDSVCCVLAPFYYMPSLCAFCSSNLASVSCLQKPTDTFWTRCVVKLVGYGPSPLGWIRHQQNQRSTFLRWTPTAPRCITTAGRWENGSSMRMDKLTALFVSRPGNDWPRKTVKAMDYGYTSILLVLIVFIRGCFELVKVGSNSLCKIIYTVFRIVDLTRRCIISQACSRQNVWLLYVSQPIKGLGKFLECT